jgi:membrane protease subunit (stomatin/prohibitin family)
MPHSTSLSNECKSTQGLAAENNGLLAEMQASERFQKAIQKYAQREQRASDADAG